MFSRRLAPILIPALALAAIVAALLTADRLIAWLSEHLPANTHAAVHSIVETLFWLTFAWFFSRLVDVFVWQTVALRTGRPAPQLLVAVVRVVILFAVIGVIITVVFQQALTGLVVSSGVIGIVLGFALQRMISDFFNGIALSMERPFHTGDWIDVDGITGRVVDTNWRATHIVTLEQVTVVLPNSFIAERRFQNYNLPDAFFRSETRVTLEYSVPPVDAKRVLIAAVRASEGVLTSPEPDVLLRELGPNGHVYQARFYVHDFADLNFVRDRVNSSIAHHLWQAGFNIAYGKQDVFHAPMPHRDINRKTERDALLSRVELFESLQGDELRQLAAALKELKVPAGQDVVRQNDAGASLFVVVDGLMEAKVEHNGQVKVVGRIGPGEFFGEISLLTGSPRGATVVAMTDSTLFELSHEVISPILKNRPEVAEEIGRFVAIRQLRNSRATQHVDPVQRAQQQRSFTDDLLQKIRGFFGIDG